MAAKKDDNTPQTPENALVEVRHLAQTIVKKTTVYVENAKVEFEDGVAKVTKEIAKALKDAGIAK